jgi:hypothetical protein
LVADEARERAADPGSDTVPVTLAGRRENTRPPPRAIWNLSLADPKSPAHLHWYLPTVELQVLAPGMARQTKDALAAGGRAGSLRSTGSGSGAIGCPVTVTWAVVWNQ